MLRPAASPATAALFELTQAVASARRLTDIYEAALDCLQQTLGVERSSILLLDESGVMRFKAARGLSEQYMEAVEGHSPWAADAADPQPVCVTDIREDADLAPLQATIEREGIRSLAFVPLISGGRLLGKFMLYHTEPHEFSDDEILQASTIGSQVAFAIAHYRGQRERQHLDVMFRSKAAGIAELDPAGNFLEFNDRFSDIVGWPARALLGEKNWFSILHPDDRAGAAQQLATMVADDCDFSIEQRYVREDGSLVWVAGTVSSLRNEDNTVRGGLALVTDVTASKTAGSGPWLRGLTWPCTPPTRKAELPSITRPPANSGAVNPGLASTTGVAPGSSTGRMASR
jgi:PAS domain S-box-containing protein